MPKFESQFPSNLNPSQAQPVENEPMSQFRPPQFSSRPRPSDYSDLKPSSHVSPNFNEQPKSRTAKDTIKEKESDNNADRPYTPPSPKQLQRDRPT